MAKASKLTITSIFIALILSTSPILAQQSTNQIVGAQPPKQNEVKPAPDAATLPPVQQMVAPPAVLPPNAVLPPAPLVVKRSPNAISVAVTAPKVNTPSVNMIQNTAPVENSEPDEKAPVIAVPEKSAAPAIPKVEVIKPEVLKFETQPISTSNVRVNSNFGYRSDPFRGGTKFHAGVDLKAAWGDPVCASEAGVIKFAGWHHGYGYMVTVDHGGGITTNYAHLSRIALPEGTKVMRGTVIGSAGSTGRSTSPHLHYEVRVNDQPVNPMHPLALEESSEYFTQTKAITNQLQPKVLSVKDESTPSTKMQQQ